MPSVLLSGGAKEGQLKLLENKLVEGKTTIYVCRDKSCQFPVTGVSKALDHLKKKYPSQIAR